jgi:hypothetical protein
MMTRVLRPLALAAGLTLLVGSAACATTINKVLSDPSHYRDRDVTISGSVSESYSVADRGFYRLNDGTGQLWIVSSHGVPRNGARVSVKGTIREAFNLGALGAAITLPPAVASGVMMLEKSHRAK